MANDTAEKKGMRESNLSKFNTALLVVVIVLLLWNLFWKPQSQSNGRFQGFAPDSMLALDTKTGQLCRTAGSPAPRPVPPLCFELK
jgi:hypothetical protein